MTDKEILKSEDFKKWLAENRLKILMPCGVGDLTTVYLYKYKEEMRKKNE